MSADEQQSVLKVLVQLVDEISEPLHRINEDFEDFSSSVHNWWTAAAEVFAGYETIEGLIEPAAAMQEKMVDLALATHASREELDRYKNTAEELAAALPVKGGAEEIAGAMAELYKTFRDNSALKEQTETAARLAVVMGSDAPTAAMVLSSAVQNLGDASKPPTEQMQKFADQFAILHDRFPAGSAGLQRMAMDLRMLGTAAQTYNIGQTSMIALLAEANRLHLGGIRGAGPILQQIIDGLLKVGKTGQSEMAKYGLAIGRTHDGHINLIATLDKMSKMSPTALRALERQLPGQAQGVSLLIKHLDDLKEAYREVDSATGETAKAAGEHTKTWDGQVQILSNSWNNLKDTIGSSGLLDSLAKLVDGVTKLINTFDTFLTVHPQVAHGIGLVITAFAGLLSLAGIWKFGTIAFDVGKLGFELLKLPAIFSMVGDAWAAASLVMEEGIGSIGAVFGLLFESNPLGWIITLVGLLAVASYEVYKHWDEIKKAIHTAREDLEVLLSELPNWRGLGALVSSVPDILQGNTLAVANNVASAARENHLHYSPTVTVNVGAGTDPGQAAQALHGVLQRHVDDLSDMMKEMHRQEERRSFLDTGNPAGAYGH